MQQNQFLLILFVFVCCCFIFACVAACERCHNNNKNNNCHGDGNCLCHELIRLSHYDICSLALLSQHLKLPASSSQSGQAWKKDVCQLPLPAAGSKGCQAAAAASPVPIHTNTNALLVSLLCVFQGTRHMTLRRQLLHRGSESGCLLLDTTAIGGRPSTNEGSKSNCGKTATKWVVICFWLGLPGGTRVKSIVYFYNVRINISQQSNHSTSEQTRILYISW